MIKFWRRHRVYRQWCIHCNQSYTTTERIPAIGTYHKRPCYICGSRQHAACSHDHGSNMSPVDTIPHP